MMICLPGTLSPNNKAGYLPIKRLYNRDYEMTFTHFKLTLPVIP